MFSSDGSIHTEDALIISEQCLTKSISTKDKRRCLMRTMSVAHATVTQNVSHFPVKPKYGCDMPNMVTVRSLAADSLLRSRSLWVVIAKIEVIL